MGKKMFVILTASTMYLFSHISMAPALAQEISGQSAKFNYSTQSANVVAVDDKSNGELAKIGRQKLAMKRVLAKYDSVLVSEVDSFMGTCLKYNLDCYLLPAISGLESTFGKFILPESHNPFGWGGGLIMFDKWEDSIEKVGQGLRENYINKGAQNLSQIGNIYSESPTWTVRVASIMQQFAVEEQKNQLYLNLD